MQAPELHRLVPAQPAGARAALEDPRLPAHQRQPLALVFRHIAQPAPGQLLEPQIVVFGHQRIPARPLVRLRQPQHHLLQIRNRCGRLLLLHTPCIHESGQNSQPLADLVVRMVTPPDKESAVLPARWAAAAALGVETPGLDDGRARAANTVHAGTVPGADRVSAPRRKFATLEFREGGCIGAPDDHGSEEESVQETGPRGARAHRSRPVRSP